MSAELKYRQQFASDNYSGICPEALEYLQKANQDHEPAYGTDRWTEEACDRFREIFGAECEVFFVATGTAGNSLSLASLCQSYHSIICHRLAHIETDECGAPEFFSHGSKLLMADGENGKLNPLHIQEIVSKRADIHYPKPKVVSVTQTTELGTVYRPEELAAIAEAVKRHSLKWQMDGARFANAVASLNVTPACITSEIGVDVLCAGGSKNGLAFGEALVFFDLEAADEFAYRCKQSGQLISKMRFIAAQWLGVLEKNVWLRYASHANAMAALLAGELGRIDEVEIMFPCEANAVFVRMPENAIVSLHEIGWQFYTFIGTGGARLMCSWDTTEATVQKFIGDLKSVISTC